MNRTTPFPASDFGLADGLGGFGDNVPSIDWNSERFGERSQGLSDFVNPPIPGFGEGLEDFRELFPSYFEAKSSSPDFGGIQFGRNENQAYHTFRHTDELGLDRQSVESAILADIADTMGGMSTGLNKGTTTVDGVEIDYHAFQLPDGTINIGRVTGK